MSILSRLFGTDKNSIKRELQRRIDALKAGRCTTGEALFVCIVGPAESFRGNPFEGDTKKEKNYKSNGSLFELGCYLLSRADVYLFANHPDVRKRIDAYLRGQFRGVFQKPLDVSDAEFSDLVYDRMEMYDRLFQESPEAETFHTTISWALHDTHSRGGRPKVGVQSRIPLVDAAADLAIKSELIQWEMKYIPPMHDAINKAVATMN